MENSSSSHMSEWGVLDITKSKNNDQSLEVNPIVEESDHGLIINKYKGYLKEYIKVICRFRPLRNKKAHIEFIQNDIDILPIFIDSKTVEIPNSDEIEEAKGESIRFVFDYVFGVDSQQVEIYKEAVLRIVDGALEGRNGTIFAYGQTLSGKTYTLQGDYANNPKTRGIMPRMASHIFYKIYESCDKYTVQISMIEIYDENILDLLDPRKINLQISEENDGNVIIKDVTQVLVSEPTEIEQIVQYGNENMLIDFADVKNQMLHSHVCIIITIKRYNEDNCSLKTSKLCIVDLAGPEISTKLIKDNRILEKAMKDNKSLNAL